MKLSKKNIYVTKSFLPPLNEYKKYLDIIWKNNQLTNQGPLLLDFENKLKKYLNVKYLHFLTNGTLALQIALNSLDITEGEIITTPFSYVATTSAILWERCIPVYVDIDPKTLCIDINKIEKAITKKTKAIMAVHVFGYPCNIEKIDQIAKKYKLKVIYDGAHAFGCDYKNKSLLNYGDISMCSFHATKVFNTIEGGLLITKDQKVNDKINLIKKFGHISDTHYRLGINAKASEFQAAMGLCNLKYVDKIINGRNKITNLYNDLLKNKIIKSQIPKNFKYNYSYYPIIFNNEKVLLKAVKILNKNKIYPRRYFYPSLNTLPYLKNHQSCPISEDISKRILCLPMYVGLENKVLLQICKNINTINS